MNPFILNGDIWMPVLVDPDDPRLTDRTGSTRIATTDPDTMCVYLSRDLKGGYLETVLLHEIGHCAMISYGILEDLHRMVPKESWVPVEEWTCNLIANYGLHIFHAASTALGRAIGTIGGA